MADYTVNVDNIPSTDQCWAVTCYTWRYNSNQLLLSKDYQSQNLKSFKQSWNKTMEVQYIWFVLDYIWRFTNLFTIYLLTSYADSTTLSCNTRKLNRLALAIETPPSPNHIYILDKPMAGLPVRDASPATSAIHVRPTPQYIETLQDCIITCIYRVPTLLINSSRNIPDVNSLTNVNVRIFGNVAVT